MKKLLATLLLVCITLCAVSCGIAKDPADLKKQLEDKDYEVYMLDDATALGAGLAMMGLPTEKAEAFVSAYNTEDDGKAILVIYYEDSAAASDAKKAIEDKIDELLEDIDEEYKDDYKVGKSGNAVYFGHKDAVKDAQ